MLTSFVTWLVEWWADVVAKDIEAQLKRQRDAPLPPPGPPRRMPTHPPGQTVHARGRPPLRNPNPSMVFNEYNRQSVFNQRWRVYWLCTGEWHAEWPTLDNTCWGRGDTIEAAMDDACNRGINEAYKIILRPSAAPRSTANGCVKSP